MEFTEKFWPILLEVGKMDEQSHFVTCCGSPVNSGCKSIKVPASDPQIWM